MKVDIQHIGGILSASAEIEPGVNAIQASNWRGKTSFLGALTAAMGINGKITEGEDRASVSLTTPEDTYVTELVRRNGNVLRRGDFYLTEEQDRVCAELFAFLGESNEIRQAVRAGDDLEELLTSPLDLENIDEQIGALHGERQQIRAQLDEAERAAGRLPTVQERVTELERDLEDLRDERSSVAVGRETEDGEDRRDSLSNTRATRERTRNRVEDIEEQIQRIETNIEERQEELDSLDIPNEPAFEGQIEDLYDQRQSVESDLDLMQAVYNANQRVIAEGKVELLTVTERGIIDDECVCWVCGQQQGVEDVREHLDSLQTTIQSIKEQRDDLRETIESLEAQRKEFRQKRRNKEDLEAQLDDLESRLADKRTSLEDARDRLADLEVQIEELESEVDDRDDRLTDIDSEIKYKEAILADERDDLSTLEGMVHRRESLQSQLDDVDDEIASLRSRKEQIKQALHGEFEAAMKDILRKFDPGFEWARLDDYELRVARDGRQTELDALSEGEIELLGIIVAIAGYEAFDVQNRVPLILLDGLGALASEHLHSLVTYLRDRTEYLVTTAYPEAGSFEGHTIDPHDWTIVSDSVDART